MLLLSVDAPLVAGTDVFVVSFIQVLFIGAFIGYAYRKGRDGQSETGPYASHPGTSAAHLRVRYADVTSGH